MTTLGSVSIVDAYRSCVEAFDRFSDALQHAQSRFRQQISLLGVETEHGRLRVWAGNLGAHRSGRSSLDHRLRQATETRKITIDFLDDLRETLCKGLPVLQDERLPYDELELDSSSDSSSSSSSSSDWNSPTELESLLEVIRHGVTCLYKLAVVLRDPTPTDRLRKAKEIDTSHFQVWDARHVGQKFPLLESLAPFLLERLGKSNSRRRQFFKYSELHNKKLKHGIDAVEVPLEPVSGTTLQPTEDNHETSRPIDSAVQAVSVQRASSSHATTLNTETTVATFQESKVVDIEVDYADEVSETSSAASEDPVGDGVLRIPEPPLGALEGTLFQCPYCFEFISTRNMIRWRKHLFLDLQPYVCTFEHCPDPQKTYGSRREWFDHEAYSHRMQWSCEECMQFFTSKGGFVEHVQHHHSDSFSEQQLPALLDMCSRPADDRIVGKCSFCFEEGQPLRRHMAHHMTALALFTLPGRDDNERGDDESNKGEAGATESELSANKGRETSSGSSTSDVMSESSQGARKEIIQDGETAEGGGPGLGSTIESAQDLNHRRPHYLLEHTGEFWDRAFHVSSQHEQWRPYEDFLWRGLGENSPATLTDMSGSEKGELMSVLVLKKADIMDDPSWQSMVDYSTNIGSLVRSMLYIRDASYRKATERPLPGLAWAGLLMLLPFIFDDRIDSAGNEDFGDEAGLEEALDYISILINRITAIQNIYLEDKIDFTLSSMDRGSQLKKSFEDSMVHLCAKILDCQAEAVSALLLERIPADDSPLPRLVADLKEEDATSRNVFSIVGPDKVKAALRLQGTRMNELFRLQKSKWQKQGGRIQKGAKKTIETLTREENQALNGCLNAFRTCAYESSKRRYPDRAPGTCEWFLKHPVYHDWSEARSSNILWVNAVPGYGKSVLMKSLIENELSTMATGTTCYFFFRDDGKDSRSIMTALTALLHQLCSQNRALLRKATEVFQLNGAKVTNSFPWLWRLFVSLAEYPKAGKVICVLDGLDECEVTGRRDIIAALNHLHVDFEAAGSQLRILLTSRQCSDIQDHLKPDILRLSGDNEWKAMQQEVRAEVNRRMSNIFQSRALNRELGVALQGRLLRVQAPTYLWLHLTFAAIMTARSRWETISEFTEHLPENTSEAYEALLKLSTNPEQATKLLHIVVAAVRPLTLQEMNMAMNIQEGQTSAEEIQIQPEQELKEHLNCICKSILSVHDHKVYFMHGTVKEWWAKRTDRAQLQSSLEYSNRLLAKICLIYISFDVFENHPPVKDDIEEGQGTGTTDKYEERRRNIQAYAQNHGLLSYAAMYWPHHYDLAGAYNVGLQNQWTLACQTQSYRFYTWFRVYWYGHARRNDLDWQLNRIPAFTSVSLAAFLGHASIVKSLARKGDKLEVKDGHSFPPLLAAIDRNDMNMAEFLIKSGASVSCESFDKWTPLGLAAAKGHGELTSHLIDCGADVEHKTYPRGTTALMYAAESGELRTIEALLRRGADVNNTDNKDWTALFYAAESRRKAAVELLVLKGADILACSYSDGTALHRAIYTGSDSLAQVLLAHGAQTDVQDEDGRTPLSFSAERGLKQTTRALIKGGSHIDSVDDDGLTPLLHAIQSGHDDIVQQLLAAGANANAFNLLGRHALWYALQSKSRKMTQMLLEAGADASMREEDGQTSLMHALPFLQELGPVNNIQCLHELGGQVDVADNDGRTALSYAAETSHISVIQALLDGEADPNKVDSMGRTPLHYAATRSAPIVQLFILAGADAEMRDAQGKAPIDLVTEASSLKLMMRAIGAG